MKKQFPDVDLLISIGGWAGTRGFYDMIKTDEGINTFADSCVDFIRTYGFDGVDIDFEYPSSTATSGNPADKDLSEPMRGILNERYNVLMKTLRTKIDAAAAKDNEKYLLTAAVTASAWVLGGITDNTYAKDLDFLSIMSYDFHGGWDEYVENLANIYPDPNDRATVQLKMPTLNMDWSYNFYRGVLPPEKILMGIPYYTRGWENVQGGNGTGLHGSSKTPATGKYNVWGDDLDNNDVLDPSGTNPLWHVLNLMEKDPNLKVQWDDVGKVPYVWQNNEKVFLSFENEKSIDERVKYIKDKNLGGALIWVMNGDFGINPKYVAGSDNINEGKYTWGDTLTKRLKGGLDAMGPAKETLDPIDNIKVLDVDVTTSVKYDHPNGATTFTLKNNTGTTMSGKWDIEFDMPKSAVYTNAEGAKESTVTPNGETTFTLKNNTGSTMSGKWDLEFDLPKSANYSGTEGGKETVTPNGEFNRVKIKVENYADIPNGGTISVKANMSLCVGGVRNIRVNGMLPVNQPVNDMYLPVVRGAGDKVVVEGSTFDVRAGITGFDLDDGNVTSKIAVKGGVDTKKVGTYNVNYSILDKSGIVANKPIKVYVVPKDHSTAVIWSSTGTYTMGNKVVYEGKIYENISWWTPPGTLPTASNYKAVCDLPVQTVTDPVEKVTLDQVAAQYNKKKGQVGYEAKFDLNSDSIIDVFDLVLVGKGM
ncbi:MAG: glycosyl hydrolase family 18 protein, partial [Clostridium sp.]